MTFTQIIKSKEGKKELLERLWNDSLGQKKNPFILYKLNLIRLGRLKK